MPKKLAAVAWQGISLRIPDDWSLVGVSGDEKKGYFRVDSPVASALEVKWSAALGKQPDLMAKGREFLSGLEKANRKSRAGFSSDLKPDKRGGEPSVSFRWRGEQLGQGRLVYCPKCDRVIIAQVVSSRDENVSHIVPAMLDSLCDHRDDGWTDWALYGLAFAVPAGYKIGVYKLMSGYVSLAFKAKAKTIVVERWGLAKTLLAGDTLREWYGKDVVPDIKGYRVEIGDETIAGHDGLKAQGSRSGIRQAVKTAAYSLTLHPHPGRFTGYAWHCQESNRLFSVRATHTEGEDMAERVRDLIKCH